MCPRALPVASRSSAPTKLITLGYFLQPSLCLHLTPYEQNISRENLFFCGLPATIFFSLTAGV